MIEWSAGLSHRCRNRAHRLRILDGSTASIYKPAWDDNTSVTVLGIDGGLLAKPVSRPFTGKLPMMMERMGSKYGMSADSGLPVGSD